MSLLCDNCHSPLTEETAKCPVCGFPVKGTKEEKTRYHVKLMDLKEYLIESEKSVKSMLSFFIVFIFSALITLVFSLLFHQPYYHYVIIFSVLAGAYYFFYFLAQRYGYYALLLAMVFYILHTIFELQAGMIPRNFLEGQKPGNGIFAFIFLIIRTLPIIYVLFRVMLTAVFIKGIYYYFRLRQHSKMVSFIKKQESSDVNIRR